MRPIMARTALTGMGLDSIKLACISGRYLRKSWRAVVQSLLSAARVISAISRGISFDATEIRPTPPSATTGSVRASSPERTEKCAGAALQISAICVRLPLASFTPAMFGTSERRATVPGSRFAPVRLGTL